MAKRRDEFELDASQPLKVLDKLKNSAGFVDVRLSEAKRAAVALNKEIRDFRSEKIRAALRNTQAFRDALLATGATAQEVDRHIARMGRRLDDASSAGSGLGELRNVFQIVGTSALDMARSIGQAAVAVFEFGAAGESLKIAKNAFAELGGTEEQIDKLRKSTQGLVSEKTITQFQSLSNTLKLTSDQTQQFGQIAVGSFKRTGISVEDALARLGTAGQKLEKEFLDELGINTRNLDVVLKEFAAERGKDVKTLSAEERQLAFVNEILANSTQQLALGAEEVNAPFAQFQVELANTQAEMQMLVAETLAGSGILEDLKTVFEENKDEIALFVKEGLKAAVEIAPKALAAFSDLAKGLGKLAPHLDKAVFYAKSLADPWGTLIEMDMEGAAWAMNLVGLGAEEATAAMTDTADASKDTGAATRGMASDLVDAHRDAERFDARMRELGRAIGAGEDAFTGMSGSAKGVKGALEGAAGSVTALNEKIDDMLLKKEDLTAFNEEFGKIGPDAAALEARGNLGLERMRAFNEGMSNEKIRLDAEQFKADKKEEERKRKQAVAAAAREAEQARKRFAKLKIEFKAGLAGLRNEAVFGARDVKAALLGLIPDEAMLEAQLKNAVLPPLRRLSAAIEPVSFGPLTAGFESEILSLDELAHSYVSMLDVRGNVLAMLDKFSSTEVGAGLAESIQKTLFGEGEGFDAEGGFINKFFHPDDTERVLADLELIATATDSLGSSIGEGLGAGFAAATKGAAELAKVAQTTAKNVAGTLADLVGSLIPIPFLGPFIGNLLKGVFGSLIDLAGEASRPATTAPAEDSRRRERESQREEQIVFVNNGFVTPEGAARFISDIQERNNRRGD